MGAINVIKRITNYRTGEAFDSRDVCTLCGENPMEAGRNYCSHCTPEIVQAEAEFQEWKLSQEGQEAQAHMRTLAALSDAIVIVKAEQEGWKIDRYGADRRRSQ